MREEIWVWSWEAWPLCCVLSVGCLSSLASSVNHGLSEHVFRGIFNLDRGLASQEFFSNLVLTFFPPPYHQPRKPAPNLPPGLPQPPIDYSAPRRLRSQI